MDTKYIKLDNNINKKKLENLPDIQNLKPVQLLPHCSLFGSQTCNGRLKEMCGHRCIYYDFYGNKIR